MQNSTLSSWNPLRWIHFQRIFFSQESWKLGLFGSFVRLNGALEIVASHIGSGVLSGAPTTWQGLWDLETCVWHRCCATVKRPNDRTMTILIATVSTLEHVWILFSHRRTLSDCPGWQSQAWAMFEPQRPKLARLDIRLSRLAKTLASIGTPKPQVCTTRNTCEPTWGLCCRTLLASSKVQS